MTVVPLLLAAAAAVLLWPAPQAHRRLEELCGRADRGSRRRTDPWLTVWALPAGALIVFGVAPGVAGALVAGAITRQRRQTRRDAARDRDMGELIAALGVMGAELSVGAPVVQACRAAASDLLQSGSSGPVADELARMAARAELGGDPGPPPSTASNPVRRLAQAWAMSLEFGLPIGEVLAALRSDLLSRQDFAARTRAGLAGPRATAAVLAGLPMLGLVLGQAMGADPARVLLGTGTGGVLLVIGTLLAVAGLAWAGRITNRAVAP
ncbi:type II secretion system F family protein [Gordonia sp. PS3]|uniref:type II secretion system F family protein n=1 Tax=Gordonia TaxID=2053 RepID=UPI0005EFB0DB|nr:MULTISPECIES: type II secretion system F family protein [Gordonia]KJR06886.1 hypothetical protein UG54_12355 [Gordonia sihwensis]KXT58220.1 hypothetical protein Y710_03850 [Gordonia sp. QH-12]